MGDCYDIVAVFERPWKEIVDELDRQFGLVKDTGHGPDEWYEHYDTKGFKLVFKGRTKDIILKTTKPEWYAGVGFWIEVFSKSEITIVDFGTCTSKFWHVSSKELLRFFEKLTNAGAVLIIGYVYGSERFEDIFGEWDQFLVYEWLEKALKHGKLEILPSGVTIVKDNLLPIEDGLYELAEIPWMEEKEYVLIKSLNGHKILVSIWRSDLTYEDSYRELLEDKTWFSRDITTLIFGRIGKRVKDEFLVKRAEEYFKAQVDEDER
ncbi:hypothetical protein OCC_13066 [Thermococcus litoralis DSM 5473]|uniref:Uncharacterized protein n=1 Tax=Thermococcus litoralis (strain ATCC 51850 / DSM 5473 / JCM 8560 / NS-C) TaxID=523849 RepID=H3ZRK0_THELN|nr:hypothetical protein [Thermococcus litoralis]EHR77406.1 hypothetical protein OCC_13066 [Thermococcus litoralis DSM 5473]